MKRSLHPLRLFCIPLCFCAIALLGAPAPSRAQEPQTYAQRYADDVMLRQIEIPLSQPSTDDYLLAIARAAKVNLFVNARFSAASPPLSGEWKTNWSASNGSQWSGAFISFLLELSNERKLTWQRHDKQTILVWSEPDVAVLGRELANQSERYHTTPATMAQEQAATRALGESLSSYLQQNKGWDGKGVLASPDIPLAELPEPLRVKLMAFTQRQIERPHLVDEGVWFRDEFWKKARLQLPFTITDPQRQLIIIGIADSSDNGIAYTARSVAFPANASNGLTFSASADAAEVEGKTLVNEAEPKAAAAQVKPVAGSSSLSADDLSRDAALQVKVSFEEKAHSVSQLLSDISKKSGVALSLKPGSYVSGLSITARGEAMKVADAMSALSALTGVEWSKSGNKSYVAQASSSAFADKMLQIGDLGQFRYWQEPARRETAPPQLTLDPLFPDWLDDLLKTARVPALQARTATLNLQEGVLVSGLPPSLRDALRHHVEAAVGLNLIRQRSEVAMQSRLLKNGCVLRIQKTPTGQAQDGDSEKTADAPSYTASVCTADGVCFASFAFSGEQKGQRKE